MSSSKSVSYGVIGWTSKWEQTLDHELVEVVSLKNLIVKGLPQVGTEVSMQYKNELWLGTILSLHGKYCCNLFQIFPFFLFHAFYFIVVGLFYKLKEARLMQMLIVKCWHLMWKYQLMKTSRLLERRGRGRPIRSCLLMSMLLIMMDQMLCKVRLLKHDQAKWNPDACGLTILYA